MPFDLSALGVLIKKIFPPKKCVSTVDTSGDGKVDALVIQAVNVVMPFQFPEEIELRDVGMKGFNGKDFDLSKYGKLLLDGERINISKEAISPESLQKRFFVYHKGESFSYEEIMKGGFGGRTVALGDEINFLFRLEDDALARFTEGKHVLMIDAENVLTLELTFELNADNMNQKFEPASN